MSDYRLASDPLVVYKAPTLLHQRPQLFRPLEPMPPTQMNSAGIAIQKRLAIRTSPRLHKRPPISLPSFSLCCRVSVPNNQRRPSKPSRPDWPKPGAAKKPTANVIAPTLLVNDRRIRLRKMRMSSQPSYAIYDLFRKSQNLPATKRAFFMLKLLYI